MDSLIEKFTGWFEGGEYYKILDICQIVFNFIAPSFSYIFLYKKHLFKELNTIQLVILCLILNSILLFFVWTLAKFRNRFINELKKEEDKLSYSDIMIDSNYETQAIVFFITTLIWFSHIYTIIEFKGSIDINILANFTMSMVFTLLIIYIFNILLKMIKLKKYFDTVSFVGLIYILLRLIYMLINE